MSFERGIVGQIEEDVSTRIHRVLALSPLGSRRPGCSRLFRPPPPFGGVFPIHFGQDLLGQLLQLPYFHFDTPYRAASSSVLSDGVVGLTGGRRMLSV